MQHARAVSMIDGVADLAGEIEPRARCRGRHRADGVFFIVMEYVPGVTLRAHHPARWRPRHLARARFACQICNARRSCSPRGRAASRPAAGNMLVSDFGAG